MKPLFNDEYETYNADGATIDDKAFAALKPIVDFAQAQGYALRDTEFILHGAVSMLCSSAVITRNVAMAKAQREANK